MDKETLRRQRMGSLERRVFKKYMDLLPRRERLSNMGRQGYP